MTDILMPALSPTMEEGTLAKWHVKKGDQVKSGDVIAEIETDKATMEVEAVDEGTVEALLVPEGAEEVKVNTPIARLSGEDGASAAGKALKSLAVSPQAIRGEIETRLSPGPEPAPRRLGRNAEAKRAMRMASRMALREGADDPLSPVGTDHLLTGVLLARHGLGHDFLVQRQVTRKRLREALRAASSSEANLKPPTGKRSS